MLGTTATLKCGLREIARGKSKPVELKLSRFEIRNLEFGEDFVNLSEVEVLHLDASPHRITSKAVFQLLRATKNLKRMVIANLDMRDFDESYERINKMALKITSKNLFTLKITFEKSIFSTPKIYHPQKITDFVAFFANLTTLSLTNANCLQFLPQNAPGLKLLEVVFLGKCTLDQSSIDFFYKKKPALKIFRYADNSIGETDRIEISHPNKLEILLLNLADCSREFYLKNFDTLLQKAHSLLRLGLQNNNLNPLGSLNSDRLKDLRLNGIEIVDQEYLPILTWFKKQCYEPGLVYDNFINPKKSIIFNLINRFSCLKVLEHLELQLKLCIAEIDQIFRELMSLK